MIERNDSGDSPHVTGDKLVAGTITADKLTANAVTHKSRWWGARILQWFRPRVVFVWPPSISRRSHTVTVEQFGQRQAYERVGGEWWSVGREKRWRAGWMLSRFLEKTYV